VEIVMHTDVQHGSVLVAAPASRPALSPGLPTLLTVDDAAVLLRTSRKAIYAMIARRQLPGVTRIGRRRLIRTEILLQWLDQQAAPSLQEKRR
jgi:excisionase family DNA binding protein